MGLHEVSRGFNTGLYSWNFTIIFLWGFLKPVGALLRASLLDFATQLHDACTGFAMRFHDASRTSIHIFLEPLGASLGSFISLEWLGYGTSEAS